MKQDLDVHQLVLMGLAARVLMRQGNFSVTEDSSFVSEYLAEVREADSSGAEDALLAQNFREVAILVALVRVLCGENPGDERSVHLTFDRLRQVYTRLFAKTSEVGDMLDALNVILEHERAEASAYEGGDPPEPDNITDWVRAHPGQVPP